MERVFARTEDCTHDGEHPDGDGVWLLPTIPLRGGMAAEGAITQAIAQAIAAGVDLKAEDAKDRVGEYLTPLLLEVYLRFGAVDWTYDEPFDAEALIGDYARAQNPADVASELYTEAVMRPLRNRLAPPSRRGSTDVSTSRNGRTPPRRRRSSPRGSAGTRRSHA